MSETVLFRAYCAAGHDWDVWGEVDLAEHPHLDRDDLRCPSCWPPRRAVHIEVQESLA